MHYSSYEIAQIMKNWKKESGATRPIMFNIKEKTIFIYTSQPGYLIGKGGLLINKFITNIQEKYGDDVRIELIEVRHYI